MTTQRFHALTTQQHAVRYCLPKTLTGIDSLIDGMDPLPVFRILTTPEELLSPVPSGSTRYLTTDGHTVEFELEKDVFDDLYGFELPLADDPPQSSSPKKGDRMKKRICVPGLEVEITNLDRLGYSQVYLNWIELSFPLSTDDEVIVLVTDTYLGVNYLNNKASVRLDEVMVNGLSVGVSWSTWGPPKEARFQIQEGLELVARLFWTSETDERRLYHIDLSLLREDEAGPPTLAEAMAG